ncbi:MAG: outer membrane protein assembly factor BamD [Deltaproteobacteria bacterium]|nr:outer membrane protein assembly factor BamD [Deltaproteobacteria bacterium]
MHTPTTGLASKNQPHDTRRIDGRRPSRAFAFAFLFLIAAVSFTFMLNGCTSANENLAGMRDPKELYDKAMTAYLDGKNEDSEKAFKTLMEEHPLSPYATEAQIMLGDVCYAQEHYDDAAAYYTGFAAMHPTHQRAAYAVFQKGMSHFKEVLSVDRDQGATKKALFAFEDLAAWYPSSPYAPKALEMTAFLKRRLAERELYIAEFYFKNSRYKGALSRLRDILKTYPDTGLSDKTLYMIGESYDKLGEKSLALDAFNNLITTYPSSPLATDAKDRLKEG